MERDVVIEKLAAIVQEKNKEHKVRLNNPNLTIIVEIMRKICGIAVVRDYYRFSKFNLHSICGIDKTEIENVVKAEKAKDPTAKGEATDETEEPFNDCEAIDQADHSADCKAASEDLEGDSTAVDQMERKSATEKNITSSGDCQTAKKIDPPRDSTTVDDADVTEKSE